MWQSEGGISDVYLESRMTNWFLGVDAGGSLMAVFHSFHRSLTDTD